MSSTNQEDSSPSPIPPPPPDPRPSALRSTSFSMPSSMPTSSAPTLALTLEPASPSSSSDTLSPFSRPPTPSSRPRTPSSRPRTPSSRPRAPAVRSASWAPTSTMSTMPTPSLSPPSTPSTWASPSSTIIATPSTPSPSLPSISRTSSACSSVVASPSPIRPTTSDRKMLESQLLSSLGRIVALVSVKDRESELFRTKRHLRALVANLDSAAHAAAAQHAHLHRHGRGVDPRRASFSKAEAKLKVGAGGRFDATELARQLDDERATTATLQGDLANALQEVAILNGYTDELSLELEKQNEENALLRNVIKGHAASEAELRAELSARMALEKQRDRDELNGLRDENIRLSLDVSAGTARYEGLMREADALRVDKAALGREVAELRATNTALKQEVADLKERAEDMADDVRRQAEHDIASLQAELGAAQDVAHAAELELEALSVAHAELQDAYGEDAAIMASKDAAFASVRADLQEREAEVAQLADKRDWLRGRLAAQAEAGMRHNELIHRPMAEKLASLAAELEQLRGGNPNGANGVRKGDGPADASASDDLDAALRDNTAATARFLDAFQAYARDVRDMNGLALRVASDVGRRLASLVSDDNDEDDDQFFDCMSEVGDLEDTRDVDEIESPTFNIVGTLYTANESDTQHTVTGVSRDGTHPEDPNETDRTEVRDLDASTVACEPSTNQAVKAERHDASGSEEEPGKDDQRDDGTAHIADLDLEANCSPSALNGPVHSPPHTPALETGRIASIPCSPVSSNGMGGHHAPELASHPASGPAYTNPETANSTADANIPNPETPSPPSHDAVHTSDSDVPNASPRPHTTPDDENDETDTLDVPVPDLPVTAPTTVEGLLAGVEAEGAYWREVGSVYGRYRQGSNAPTAERDGGVREILSPKSLGVELQEDGKADAHDDRDTTPNEDPEEATAQDDAEAAGNTEGNDDVDLPSRPSTLLSAPEPLMAPLEDGSGAAVEDTEADKPAASQPPINDCATDVPVAVGLQQEEPTAEAPAKETEEVDGQGDSAVVQTSRILDTTSIEAASTETASIGTVTTETATTKAAESVNGTGETFDPVGETVAAGPPTRTEPAPTRQADPTSPHPPQTTRPTDTAGPLDPEPTDPLPVEQAEPSERVNGLCRE